MNFQRKHPIRMQSFVAQIAPQRSTQYASLSSGLAQYELALCPVNHCMSSIRHLKLGGHEYIRFELEIPPDDNQLQEWGMLSMTSAFFEYYDTITGHTGPFLRPMDIEFHSIFSRDLVMTRRYRGKTNEMFTQFLCNIARFSSKFSHKPWNEIRVFDPLAGGGTTLFTALMLGANTAGVEKKVRDVQSTVAFLKQYMKNEKMKFSVKEERLKKLGKRWRFAIGKEKDRACVLSSGKTVDSIKLIEGFKKPHLIVTDLPYGIQHHTQLIPLLKNALPVWSSMLMSGGVLAMAWESTRFPRRQMIDLIESETGLVVRNDSPYDKFAHRVDRVIKERDVLVAQSH